MYRSICPIVILGIMLTVGCASIPERSGRCRSDLAERKLLSLLADYNSQMIIMYIKQKTLDESQFFNTAQKVAAEQNYEDAKADYLRVRKELIDYFQLQCHGDQ